MSHRLESVAGDPGDAHGLNEIVDSVAGSVVQACSIEGNIYFNKPDRHPVTPRQLPGTIPNFVGRRAEIGMMTRSLHEMAVDTKAVAILAINGTAGVGKTELAVYWARQVVDQFPGGQLYIDLRGFDPTGTPMDPAEAIRSFLDAFGISSERIPMSLDAQAGLYRSLLADRQVLVLLDNARDAEQVRPLLPGGPSCCVLITSRNRLTGLIVNGARPVTLDLPSYADSTELLTAHLGQNRVMAESIAVTALIEHCARLPLALTIVAARATADPDFPLAVLAEELQHEQARLNALDAGDQTTNVRTVLSWSYRMLAPETARIFRLLGVHPGAEVGLRTVASLAGVSILEARKRLKYLAASHLLTETIPGRYRFHDLLRAYAVERATEEESEHQQQAATHRMLDYYLHSSFAAALVVDPHRYRITIHPPRGGVTPCGATDHQQAEDWFTTERANLISAIEKCSGTCFDNYVWQISWTLSDFFHRNGHWRDDELTQQAALAAARRLGNHEAQAHAHRLIGRTYTWVGQHSAARVHLQQALSLYSELEDRHGEARTHLALNLAWQKQGRYTEAISHAWQALTLSRAIGDRSGEAETLNSVGWCNAHLGNYQQALTSCRQSLDLHRIIGDHFGVADVLLSLGYIYHCLDDYAKAFAYYDRGLRAVRQIGAPYHEADALTRLGNAYYAAHDLDAARNSWQQALNIFDQLSHPDAEHVRTKLTDLGHAS